MNDDTDWNDLTQRHLAGIASPEEATTLEEALKTDADLRSLYVDYANLDMALGASAEAAKALQEVQALPVSALDRNSRPLWPLRPAAAVAAGLLLGVLTSSVVWAVTAPKIPQVTRINVPLVDPGFEEVTTPVPAVIPRALNRWNGDDSHTVSAEDSPVKPKQGRFMMKMQPVEQRRYSRIEQIVDVRHLVLSSGGTVEFSASTFCDGAVNQTKMILVLRAFTIGSEEISGSTEKLDDQVTSEARKTVFIPPGSTDWHTGNLRMDLPENTKTLVFAIAAIDLPEASKGSSRYIDDIKATIVTTRPAEIQQ